MVEIVEAIMTVIFYGVMALVLYQVYKTNKDQEKKPIILYLDGKALLEYIDEIIKEEVHKTLGKEKGEG